MSNFMKILQMGAELFHGDALTAIQTDRQTDMTKLIVTFHTSANELRKLYISLQLQSHCFLHT